MRYFVIEGVDTSGKSTQWNLLRDSCNGMLLSDSLYPNILSRVCPETILFTQEPSNTSFGKMVRDMVLHKNIVVSQRAIFLLFLAQRAELIESLKPLPNIIISDRSLISGIAYAMDIDIEQAFKLNCFATQDILPHKIVFLELSFAAMQTRIEQKTAHNIRHNQIDSIELKGVEYLYRIQSRFKESLSFIQHYGKKNQNIEILYADASQSKEFLHKQISHFFLEKT